MELTLNEAKKLIKYIIQNNKILQSKGEYPISVCIQGLAGLGKSAIARQISEELNANFIFLNLSSLTDPSELCGWPIKEHYVCKEDECVWITGELVESYSKAGYQITEDTRMSYALPSWLKGLDINKPTILVLDDVTRCAPSILQALLPIIYEQRYISWELPRNTTVILTSNPDNGDYNVASVDEAFSTRMVTFNVKFDIKGWIKYADSKGIDGRAINFLALHHHELMDSSVTKVSKLNARSYTMFANIIGGIPDWSNPASLASIMQIASACFPNDGDNVIASLFTQFIANKLDKLITPEDLVHGSWNTIKTTLEDQLYDGSQYRADIASVITTRFVNYCMYYFTLPNCKSEVINKRIIELVENPKTLLTEDLVFSMIKTITKKYPQRTAKLLLVSSIVKKLI